jgi:hypothetical protein
MVAEGHELIESSTYLQNTDPVFGPEVEEKFARLFESVQERILEEEER